MAQILRRIRLSEAEPGMMLGKPILSEAGKVILSENTLLTEMLIERLQAWGYDYVDICEEIPENFTDMARKDRQYFAAEYGKTVESVKEVLNKVRYFKEVPVEQVTATAGQVMELLVQGNAIISLMNMLNNKNDYTFQHSVNVAVISGTIGQWLEWEESRVAELVLAGLLHDVGKARVPLEILNKPDVLEPDEMEIMKQHPIYGYELIAESSAVSMNVKQGVLQHHERLDGSGYPYRLSGGDISPLAKIVAVADVYDAMTSNRVYRSALAPFTVLEELFSEMFTRLDPPVCGLFINNLRETLIGSVVKLTNGATGKVIYIDRERNAKPLIQTADGRYLDLERDKTVGIMEIIMA